MKTIQLKRLEPQDEEALLRFETENRAYFERSVPGRGDDYYQPAGFAERHRELLSEQAEDLARFYLVQDELGRIVGRANLNDIDRIEGTAEVGYRIGEAWTGHGLAKRTLMLLIDEAKEAGLKRLYAKTTLSNPASRVISESGGFVQVRIEESDYELGGQRVSFVHYARGIRGV
ncbi:GNAT family N-acetyltransferase [Saccharibacillus deserti]|uniref:GNAT family N-acetyltransferase n=1 Tax=Saccharibacillus deserti TaxID=1634444 RepID=UPI001554B4BD|nr:GNAT family protein [Saccharibacillus deserti]